MNRRAFIKASAVSSGSLLLSREANAATPAEPASGALVGVREHPMASPRRLPNLTPAEWIWAPGTRCLPNTFVLFRREISLRAQPTRATGWIVADSRYRLDVNGSRVQWGPAPSDPRFAEADPLDLTEHLHAGANVFGATVLFYGHGDGTWAIGKPGFLFWLEIEYAGGEKETVASDAKWQTQITRAWPAGQYKRWFLRSLQEEFDAREYPFGWNAPGFATDGRWAPAMLLGGSPNQPALLTKFSDYASGVRSGPAESELRPRSIPKLREIPVLAQRLAESFSVKWHRPVREHFETRPAGGYEIVAKEVATPAGPGAWQARLDRGQAVALTFEFAEQIVGFPFFTIEAPAGTVVELMWQEGHAVGGPPLLDTQLRNAWTRFICRDGKNEFEAFDFESLRWLQVHVHDAEGSVVVSRVGVRRRMYPWKNEPVIRTSEPALQRLFEACVNSMHNGAQETIVDGMGRERQQYSGDCGHQLHAIRLAFGEAQLPARFLTTFSQGMTTSGYFLDCWPGYDRVARAGQRHFDLFHFGTILDHGVQFIFDCWHHYWQTGDLDALREPYPRLLRFANYLHGTLGADGLLPVENLGIPFVWMDYDAFHQGSGVFPKFTQRRKQCAYNLYVAATLQHGLTEICRLFGDGAAAATLEKFGRQLQARAVERFWSRERGLFVDNLPWLEEEKTISLTDRSLATAILFDQCPGGDIAEAVRTLAECPAEMGLSYPANSGWRYWALAKAGRVDVILNDLRNRWATMDSVRYNNSMPEPWKAKPDTGQQWSFCSVAPLYIAHQGLAGIRALAPGFKRIEIRPQLGNLEKLELVTHTPIGPIGFQANGALGARDISVQLPAGSEGELVVHAGEKINLPRATGDAPPGHSRYRLGPGPTSFRLTLT